MTQTTTQVSQYGITWEFDGEYTVGQYANGDWWVEGPVTITKITPESTEVDGRVINGTMINPVGGTQGFDSYDSDMGYDPDLNVDPGATGEDLVVDECSVVSSISLDSPNSNGRPVLSDLAILTVVPEQPAADAFRPGPYSDDKSPQWTESDLDYGVLRSLPMLDSAPDLDAVTQSVERFWNEQETSWQQRAVHAENNQEIYGREIAYALGDALLSLHLDYSEEQKRDLFVNMVQRGIDIYDRAFVGGVWEDNCGHNPGRKMPMLFAGLALDDDAIVEMGRAERPREEFLFQEDRQTFIVSEEDIENPAHTDEQNGEAAGETDANGNASGTLTKMPVDPETLPPIVPGSVEFEVGEFPDGEDDTVLETITDDGNGNLTGSESATGSINYDDGSWEITGSVAGESVQVGYEYSVAYLEEDLGTPEWGCQYTRDYGNSANSLWGASYRWIGSSFMHHGLTAHLMDGAVDAWNHPPFFEYLDRYVENGSPASGTKNGIQPFAEEFWNEYRAETTEISQHGITWHLEGDPTVGQYANGDWWAEGPVTITKITPESTEVDGRVMHGTMLNPVGNTQGYDSFDTDVPYDADLNVDPGATGEDLTVEEGSVVSSISLESPDPSGRPLVSDLAILTVVTEKPPEDAFRPDPYRESKQHQWRESEFDDSILRELPITDEIADHLPDLAEARREALRFWNDQDTGWTQRPLHAENNQPTYHTNVGRRSGAMGLLLHLDIDGEIKRDLLVGFVQHGLDVHARLQLDPDYNSGQKIKTGRKLKVVLAAVGFDDEELRSTADREEDRARFQEDADTFFVSQDDVGKEVEDGNETYREEDLGMPEWGTDHWRDGTRDDRTWETSYRYEGSAFVPTVLTARLTPGAREAWNHPALFAYTDRYEFIGWESPYPIRPFAQACWDAYRTPTGTVAVTAGGETIPSEGTARLSLYATSVETVVVRDLWTDWTVTVDNPAGATTTDDRVSDAGELELGWDTVQSAAALSITIDPPADTYVGGTYAVDVVAHGGGESDTDTALVEIDDSGTSAEVDE